MRLSIVIFDVICVLPVITGRTAELLNKRLNGEAKVKQFISKPKAQKIQKKFEKQHKNQSNESIHERNNVRMVILFGERCPSTGFSLISTRKLHARMSSRSRPRDFRYGKTVASHDAKQTLNFEERDLSQRSAKRFWDIVKVNLPSEFRSQFPHRKFWSDPICQKKRVPRGCDFTFAQLSLDRSRRRLSSNYLAQ